MNPPRPVHEDRLYITVQSEYGSAEETEAAIAQLIDDAAGLTIDAIAVFRVQQAPPTSGR